jgi:hypothetical protein
MLAFDATEKRAVLLRRNGSRSALWAKLPGHFKRRIRLWVLRCWQEAIRYGEIAESCVRDRRTVPYPCPEVSRPPSRRETLAPASDVAYKALVVRTVLSAVLASLLLGAAGSSLACNVPVFRYALERWHPDDFEVTLLHHGPLRAGTRRTSGSGSLTCRARPTCPCPG